jgi:hypothetical protein
VKVEFGSTPIEQKMLKPPLLERKLERWFMKELFVPFKRRELVAPEPKL